MPAMNPPNILVVMADDHAQGALGCYGNQTLCTPNTDYVAASGVRFANAFAPSPVCSPARASFFTGRIPSQHGVHDFLTEAPGRFDGRWLVGETLLPQLLQRAGYQTGLVGKWHCTADSAEPPPGFDFWVSYDVHGRHWSNQYQHRGAVGFVRDGLRREVDGFQSSFLTAEAQRFLRTRDRSRPFFLFVGYVDTHFPFAGQPERLVARYRHRVGEDLPADRTGCLTPANAGAGLPADHREHLAQYYAAVTLIDEQLGVLLDHLDAGGDLDNTLVVYTSDHGHMNGQHGLVGKGNATQPQNFYEESIRIPLLARWPGQLPGGTTWSAPVDHCDLFCTILDACAVELTPDEDQRIHSPGCSILGAAAGTGAEGWRSWQCCEYGNARMITDLRYKLVRRYPPHAGRYTDELYDLAVDPREAVNRIHEPSYAAVIGRLDQRMNTFYTRYADLARSGTRVMELPQHNDFEPWRRQV